MSPMDDAIDRRTVLKQVGAIGATGAALGAASGSGAAASAGESTIRPLPVGRIAVERLFDELAGELLAELSAAGKIRTESASTLSLDTDAPAAAHAEYDVSGLYIDDELGKRSLITAETRTDDGVVTISVEPERELAYAFFEPRGDDETLLYTAENGAETLNDAETSSCHGCTCYYNYPCSGSGRYIEVCTYESNSGLPCVTRQGCC